MKAGQDAQRRSLTLLKNDNHTLPLVPNKLKIYIKNINPKVAAEYGTIVDDPKQADIAIIRLQTPNYPVAEAKGNFIAQLFHFGDLDFKGQQLQDVLDLEVEGQRTLVLPPSTASRRRAADLDVFA